MPTQPLWETDSGPGRLGARSGDLPSSRRSRVGRLAARTPPPPVCRLPAEPGVDPPHPAHAATDECMGEVVDLPAVRCQLPGYATGTVSWLELIVGTATRTPFPRSCHCRFCLRDGGN